MRVSALASRGNYSDLILPRHLDLCSRVSYVDNFNHVCPPWNAHLARLIVRRADPKKTVYHQQAIHAHTPSDAHIKPVKPKQKVKLRLEVRDLTSLGAKSFLTLIEAGSALEDAVSSVLNLLYTPHSELPTTRYAGGPL